MTCGRSGSDVTDTAVAEKHADAGARTLKVKKAHIPAATSVVDFTLRGDSCQRSWRFVMRMVGGHKEGRSNHKEKNMMNIRSCIVSLLCGLALVGCSMEDEQQLVSRAQPAALMTNAMAASNTVSATDDCATVAAWVGANIEALPTSYEGFVGFPMNYRRAIFNAIPAEQKSTLWQQHLSRYLEEHPGLSATQVDIVQRAMAVISADLYRASDDGTEHHEALEALRAPTEDAFGKEEARRILATLGPDESEGSSVPEVRDCDCSTESEWCAPWNDCETPECEESNTGCGEGWSHPCDGVCR